VEGEEGEGEVVEVSAGAANVAVEVVVDEGVVRGVALACCCCFCCCRLRKDWIDGGEEGGANPRTPQPQRLLSLVHPRPAKAAAVRRVAMRVMVGLRDWYPSPEDKGERIPKSLFVCGES
jgi:hypothetical protein